ncbi:hypothetical protein [Streptomyces sp. NPDC001787]|uniref:hypothetical protein n=1 Tax=Streptomyces sp. NPDC001787 TaxID=3154523 RepID=UPI0033261C34
MTDAAFTFELGGARVLSEREVRRAEATTSGRAEQVAAVLTRQPDSTLDGRGRERFLCAPVGAGGRVHYPDLVVAAPLGLVADFQAGVEPHFELDDVPAVVELTRAERR